MSNKKDSTPPSSNKTISSGHRKSQKPVNSYNHLSLAPRLDSDNFQNLCKSKKLQPEQSSSSEAHVFENKYNELTHQIKELHQEFLYNCLTEVFHCFVIVL